jgi:hypothetical protein
MLIDLKLLNQRSLRCRRLIGAGTTMAILISAFVITGCKVSKSPDKPKVQETFLEISLETTKSDIKFLKGNPSEVREDGSWEYNSKKGNIFDRVALPGIIHINFDGDKIKYVEFYGVNFKDINSENIVELAPELQGIKIDDTSSKIQERLGKPLHISSSDDELKRIFLYDKYHIFFILEQNRVKAYGIYNPEFGPLKFEKRYHHLDPLFNGPTPPPEYGCDNPRIDPRFRDQGDCPEQKK